MRSIVPTKSKVLIALKKAEDEDSLNMPSMDRPHGWGNERPSGALFLSNALELEDLQ